MVRDGPPLVVQLPNGRFALAPHLFLKFVYQQYDIKAQRRDGIFKYCDVVADLSEMVFKAALPARKAGFSQNAFRDLFPKTVRDAIAAWISSADFFVVEGRLWGPLENAASIISF
jgi:hypothetical protein